MKERKILQRRDYFNMSLFFKIFSIILKRVNKKFFQEIFYSERISSFKKFKNEKAADSNKRKKEGRKEGRKEGKKERR